MARPRVLLATFDLLPGGEDGGETVVAELAARGVDARWAVWDDGSVDWAAADLVAVRSTWDYHRRLAPFLAWARSVGRRTRLLNGAEVFAWNADKAYLVSVADRMPVVPTSLVDDRDLVGGLRAGLERYGEVVVKGRVGASGVGVVVADSTSDERLSGLLAGPWILQPLVPSVRTRGETSVFVLGGRAVSQVDKLPAAGEIRVHEQYGGRSRQVPLAAEPASAAESAIRVAGDLLGVDLDYARVDLMTWEDRLVVSELELIEPGLYLDLVPDNAAHFAALVADRLGAGPAGVRRAAT